MRGALLEARVLHMDLLAGWRLCSRAIAEQIGAVARGAPSEAGLAVACAVGALPLHRQAAVKSRRGHTKLAEPWQREPSSVNGASQGRGRPKPRPGQASPGRAECCLEARLALRSPLA